MADSKEDRKSKFATLAKQSAQPGAQPSPVAVPQASEQQAAERVELPAAYVAAKAAAEAPKSSEKPEKQKRYPQVTISVSAEDRALLLAIQHKLMPHIGTKLAQSEIYSKALNHLAKMELAALLRVVGEK